MTPPPKKKKKNCDTITPFPVNTFSAKKTVCYIDQSCEEKKTEDLFNQKS